MSMDQWVNLPRDDKFVEDSITEKKRLDFVRISVKFKKDIAEFIQSAIKD